MQSINITKVREDWYIITLRTLTGKIYTEYGTSKLQAVENLILSYNKN